MDEKNIVIGFEITIKDEGYRWDAVGRAKVEMSMPLSFVELIDPGTVLIGSLKAAIVDYQEKKIKKEKEDNEDEEE